MKEDGILGAWDSESDRTGFGSDFYLIFIKGSEPVP